MKNSGISFWKEHLLLLWVNLNVTFRHLYEYIRVIFRYYPNLIFAKVDLSLLFSYFFHNPFRISKRFLMQRGEKEIYTYGETPLTTLEKITQNCGIKARDTVFELGCGRGRTCFWLQAFVGCEVIGIDHVPFFIEKAQNIQHQFALKNLLFRQEDILQTDLAGATVIYLYGTCFSSIFINLLIDRLLKLPAGTKIITTSYALTEYRPYSPLKLVKRFPATFSWGETDVYLHILGSYSR